MEANRQLFILAMVSPAVYRNICRAVAMQGDIWSAQELDELIKVATGRKDEELARAKAGFLDEVKARVATQGCSTLNT